MTASILETILNDERRRVDALTRERSLDVLRRAVVPRPATTRVRDLLRTNAPSLIAEVKRGSPSRGRFVPEVDPVAVAVAYAGAGAEVISVVTNEKHFFAEPRTLERVRAAVTTPLLAKDFFIDPYQVYLAAEAGADVILLIVAALDDRTLFDLLRLATELGLETLVETHDEGEIARALAADARIIGINNRDLRTFEVDLARTERLAPRIPQGRAIVAESGVRNADDVARLRRAGAHAVLVGEALVTDPFPGQRVLALREGGVGR